MKLAVGMAMAEPRKKPNRFWRKPLDSERYRRPRGEVHVLPERCKGCGLCIEYCPTEVLDWSFEFNPKGYHYPVVKKGKESDCINCKFCEEVCPDFAIFNLKVEAGE
jgi:2-oxoglutarate ferredoxin oxidoreductase subunit delta